MMGVPGPFETLTVMMMAGGLLSGGGLLSMQGLPPGERDPRLVQAAPEDAVLYVEWSARGEGKPGAPGIDGLAADPEILLFLAGVERAILESVERDTAGGTREQQILGRAVPPLVKRALNSAGSLSLAVDANAIREALAERGADPWTAIQHGLRATLIVNAGGQADKVAARLNELLELLPADTRTADLQRQPIPVPVPDGDDLLTLHREGSRFILGFGRDTIDVAVAGLTNKSPGLAASPRFEKAMRAVLLERTVGVTWIDLRGAMQKVTAAAGPAGLMIGGMAATLGADAFDSVASCTGVTDGQVHSRTFVTTGGRTDKVLSLAAGRGLKAADFEHVPADADLVFGGSLHLPAVLRAVRELIGEADPSSLERFNDLLSQVEQELGVSFEDEVFEAFGDAWVAYNAPSAGGLLISHLVVGLEVRDARKAERVYGQLMQVLKEGLPGERDGGFRRRAVHLAEGRFLDRTVHFINTVGDEMPFSPAFCLTERQLLIAPHPQALKAHVRFLKDKGETFAPRIADDLRNADGDVLCCTRLAPRAFAQYLTAISPYLAQVVFGQVQAGGGQIDVFSFPSGKALLPYLGDSRSMTVRTADGLLFETHSALPGGGGGFLLNVALMSSVTAWSAGPRIHVIAP